MNYLSDADSTQGHGLTDRLQQNSLKCNFEAYHEASVHLYNIIRLKMREWAFEVFEISVPTERGMRKNENYCEIYIFG